MTLKRERTINTNNEANVPLLITANATTAVTVIGINLERTFFEIDILPKMTDVCVFIRLYEAAQDDIMRGAWIGRFTFGNSTFFREHWRMPTDNIYTGEISVILLAGDPNEDVYITEY